MYIGASRSGNAIIIEPVGSAPSTPSPKAINATNATLTVYEYRYTWIPERVTTRPAPWYHRN